MDSTQTKQPIYQGLDATISEIRVLTLHQGARDQELRCTLKTVSLDDNPAFHALSYVWGAGTEKGHINIDGHVVPVTSNLATVLTQFRSHHHDSLQLHSMPMWIDAICINQADLEERALQVRLMGRIYRQASRVLMWLGEGDEVSGYALDRMNNTTFRDSCLDRKATSRAPTLDEIKVKVIFDKNLERRRYWTRTWTLQEAVLASEDPVMLCGSRQIPWSRYMQCKSALLGFDEWSYPGLAFDWVTLENELPWHRDAIAIEVEVSRSSGHENIRKVYHESGSVSLGLLLTATNQLQATDPRDHVYAVLGLVSNNELRVVNIDYRKTPARLFRDAMAAVWSSGIDDLVGNIIPKLSFGREIDNSELPSWVPNLAGPRSIYDNLYEAEMGYERWQPERQAEIHVEGNTLTVKAIKFDTITDIVTADFDPGWTQTFHRGKAEMKMDIETLETIEFMAQRGRKIPIPASDRLAPFLALRDRTPIWDALTLWNEENDGWLSGVPRDRQKLWDVLLGRQEIPETWKMACSPEIRNDTPALEAAILPPLLSSIEIKVNGRKVFVSRFGFLGIGTMPVEAGDVVIFIAGMIRMYVLRPFRDGYLMVGFAILPGLMDWNRLDEAMRAGTLHEEELKIY